MARRWDVMFKHGVMAQEDEIAKDNSWWFPARIPDMLPAIFWAVSRLSSGRFPSRFGANSGHFPWPNSGPGRPDSEAWRDDQAHDGPGERDG